MHQFKYHPGILRRIQPMDNVEGAIVEFSVTFPADEVPIPVQLEHRLLTETHAASFYDQVHTPDSPLNRDLRHRLQLASVGTEWQKYFSDRPV